MAPEPGLLAHRLKSAALEGGAAVAGIADLTGPVAEPAPRSLFALVFGLRYPDQSIERLPVEDELAKTLGELGSTTQRIYSVLERILLASDGGARCCRHDAVESTFGAFRTTLSQKAVAVLAGLGWIGKSSLLVTPVHGPRVRLGTLYTDALLLPDDPFPTNHCGDCHICREACPAGAVTEESVSFGRFSGYRIDSAKCRAHISRDERSLGKREFCGVCLKECPFGR